jgi:hypothetical protein
MDCRFRLSAPGKFPKADGTGKTVKNNKKITSIKKDRRYM